MANVSVKNSAGDVVYLKATGAGTDLDPHVPAHTATLAASDGTDIGNVDIASLPSDTFAADGEAYGKGVLVQGSDGTDRHTVLLDADGHLQADVLTSPATGGTSMTDDAGFTVGSSSLTPAGGIYRSTRDSVDDGDAGALAMTAKRAPFVVLETPNGDLVVDETNDAVKVVNATAANLNATVAQGTGTNLHTVVDSGTITTVTNVVHVDDNASALTVDGSVTVTQGTGTNLHAVVDSGTVTTITNVVHVDDNSSTLSIDDGSGAITVDGSVTVTQGTGTNLHAVVDSGTITTVTNVVHVDDNAGTLSVDGTVTAQGAAAVGAAISGSPVPIGGKALTAFPAAVDTGDAVYPTMDKYGRLLVVESMRDAGEVDNPAALTDNSAHDVSSAAAGANTIWVLDWVTITNSHATVGTLVSIRDDNGTPKVMYQAYAAAVGGGVAMTFSEPKPTSGTNQKVQAICGTTGSGIYISAGIHKEPA
ncbi:MAG: hypothetical protein QG671_3499 [Actinomycetota bacterium]|nr:hypothetical protein [Actinomycetota bacterium]